MSASREYPQTAEQTEIRVEIQPTTEHGPTFTVTIFSEKVVTACYIQNSFSSNPQKPVGGMLWDSILQGGPPIEPGAAISENLGHVVGGPIPDKIEVVAGIFANGSTFGPQREVETHALESRYPREGIQLCRLTPAKGLDENWTSDQYLAALDPKNVAAPRYGIRRTLEVNEDLYDSLYVALVVSPRSQLITADEKLANALVAKFSVRWLGAYH